MKFKSKKIIFIITALLCATLLFGCSSASTKAPTKEYTNKLNTFKISVAGDWTTDNSSNEDNITLDNEDRTLTVIIQKFPKELPNMQQFKTLDDFIPFYEKIAISNLLQMGEVSKLEKVDIDGVTDAKGYEIVASQDDMVSKAYITYIQTEKGFYSATITGVEKLYDKNIDALKEAIKTIEEIK